MKTQPKIQIYLYQTFIFGKTAVHFVITFYHTFLNVGTFIYFYQYGTYIC